MKQRLSEQQTNVTIELTKVGSNTHLWCGIWNCLHLVDDVDVLKIVPRMKVLHKPCFPSSSGERSSDVGIGGHQIRLLFVRLVNIVEVVKEYPKRWRLPTWGAEIPEPVRESKFLSSACICNLIHNAGKVSDATELWQATQMLNSRLRFNSDQNGSLTVTVIQFASCDVTAYLKDSVK
jgi:hypothetical protein